VECPWTDIFDAEATVDVVVTGQQLLESGQILSGGQGEPVQPIHGVAALLLGEFFPLGDALQILDPILQTQLLLIGERDDRIAHAALQMGELRIEVSGVFVEVFFAKAL
jgi:hypothetical protein